LSYILANRIRQIYEHVGGGDL